MIRAGLVIVLSVFMAGCMRAEVKKTRDLKINDVSIDGIPDGSYTGSYEYGGFAYTVRCVASEGRVVSIKILNNRTTKYAKMAEQVVQRVIEQQKLDVDVITGATSTSKAFLKATEKALTKGASRAEE